MEEGWEGEGEGEDGGGEGEENGCGAHGCGGAVGVR